jgi:AcrR family transcriptional regulator
MTRSQQPHKKPDPRALRTRRALLAAFRDLLLEGKQLEGVRAASVAARAGVSRSTLYEHFAGVEGLVSTSIATPFAVLVDALETGDNIAADLQQLLDHFWAANASQNPVSGPDAPTEWRGAGQSGSNRRVWLAGEC